MATNQIIKILPGIPRKMEVNDIPTFDEWMARVDRLLYHYIGCVSADLVDCNWQDWYMNRMRPIWAAKKSLKNYGRD